MSTPERPGQDFSTWKAGSTPESEKTDWVVEHGVRFDPKLSEQTRQRLLQELTQRQAEHDWGDFAQDTRTWFEHNGIGSTAVPTPDVLTPYALQAGAMTPDQVAAARTGVERFLDPGLDPEWLEGKTSSSSPWDVRLAFADDAARKAFTEFAKTIPPYADTNRIYVGLAPAPFNQETGKIQMPLVTNLGEEQTSLPDELRGKILLEAFRLNTAWLDQKTRAELTEPFEIWVDAEGLRIQSEVA